MCCVCDLLVEKAKELRTSGELGVVSLYVGDNKLFRYDNEKVSFALVDATTYEVLEILDRCPCCKADLFEKSLEKVKNFPKSRWKKLGDCTLFEIDEMCNRKCGQDCPMVKAGYSSGAMCIGWAIKNEGLDTELKVKE